MNNKIKIEKLNQYAAFLSEKLQVYDKIFLIKDGSNYYENLTEKFCNFIFNYHNIADKKILILSCSMPLEFIGNNSIKIERETERYLIKLYHLYSFSDKFYLLAESKNQGDIFNFVDAGQLSLEEVFKALLE